MIQIMLIYDCGIFSIHKKILMAHLSKVSPVSFPIIASFFLSSMKTSITHVLLSDESRVSVVIVTDIQGASIMS